MTTGPLDNGRRAPATLLLALVCVLAFGWTWWASGLPVVEDAGRLDPAQLKAAGALDWLEVRDRDAWWRLFSAVILHGSWWHLTFNLWALFVLGSSVEMGAGLVRWFGVVALSAAGSGLAALAWGSANMVVGISGVVFGLGGYLVTRDLIAHFARREFSRKTSTQSPLSEESKLAKGPHGLSSKELAFWLGATLAIGFVWPELSQAGHLGGLAMGVCFAVLDRGGKSSLLAILVFGIAGTVATRAVVAEPRDAEDWERMGYALLDADRPAEAWPYFDRALHSSGPDEGRVPEWKNASAYARAIGSNERQEWLVGVELVRDALGSEPDNPNRLDTLGWLQCRLGKFEMGSSTLERALELMGDKPSAEVIEHLSACASP